MSAVRHTSIRGRLMSNRNTTMDLSTQSMGSNDASLHGGVEGLVEREGATGGDGGSGGGGSGGAVGGGSVSRGSTLLVRLLYLF